MWKWPQTQYLELASETVHTKEAHSATDIKVQFFHSKLISR